MKENLLRRRNEGLREVGNSIETVRGKQPQAGRAQIKDKSFRKKTEHEHKRNLQLR